MPVVLLIAFPFLIEAIGGAWSRRPDELDATLSRGARKLVRRAYKGIEDGALFDYHTHLVGLGAGGSGCFVHPGMLSWWSVTRRVQFEVYRSASGIEDDQQADAQYVARLLNLVRHSPGRGRHLLLGFDKHYRPDGTVDLDKTEMYTPNEYAWKIARAHPERFAAAVSIHPHRADALAELERWAKRGVRIVKWLPNAMGIDPSLARHDPYYKAMRKHRMVLLSHAGEEWAVDSEEDQRFGNPLYLRRPLDLGVKVIVAHCASLATNVDLDDAARPQRSNFDLFLRLMDDPKYAGLAYGDLSAMTQRNRIPGPLRTLLTRTDLHSRLVNGSDYPLPAVNIVISTGLLVDEGFLTAKERAWLNEIYDCNPLLFDFVLKRTLRGPNGERFPASVFREHPGLPPSGDD
ncbi:MAG: amidohydrolase family protein [Planctomycetota bacterium]